MRSHTASQDPLHRLNAYEIRHLASHLLEAREYRNLHQLLELKATNQRNAWFEAKSRIGDTVGYIAEIEAAWKIVELRGRESVLANRSAIDLPLQLRYAFISAVLAGIAAQPSRMLVAFAEQGLWTIQDAVAYSLQVNDWRSQLQSVTALAENIPDGLPRLTCEKRALSLIAAGPKDFRSRSVVGADSETAWGDYMLSAQCLDRLAQTLPDHLVPDSISAGKAIPNWFWSIYGLRKLCPRIASPDRQILVDELWAKAIKLRLRFLRAESCSILAPLFEGAQRAARIDEAFLEAINILNDWEARKILAEEPRSGTFTYMHDIQRHIEEDVRPLRLIAPHANAGQITTALQHVAKMDPLPRYEALLILLPELAAKKRASGAFKRAGKISHPVYKNLIEAAIAPFLPKAQKTAVVDRACRKLAALEEIEVRSFCLATISVYLDRTARVATFRSIIRDLEVLDISKNDSLCASVLGQVAEALAACPKRHRVAIARDAVRLAKRLENSSQDLLISALVPWLDVADIAKEFRDVRSVAFGAGSQALRAAWSQSDSKQAAPWPKSIDPRPVKLLIDVLAGAHALTENQRSRLVILAAPILGPESWELAIDVARSIGGKYLKVSALRALVRVVPDSLKSELALETIESIWALSGGIEGAAALLEELVQIVVTDRVVPLFESWSTYVRSLSRESWHTMLRYLEPMRCVIEALGGAESPREALNSIEVVELWFGKRKDTADEPSESGQEKYIQSDRFSEISVPSTSSAILDEIVKLFVEAHQFDRAERMLSVLQGTDHDSNNGAWHTVRIANELFTGLSGAGRFEEAIELLSRMESPSPEGLNLLVRRLISHGRAPEAHDVLEAIAAKYGTDTALPLACVLLETHLAEDNITDAMSLFQRLEFVRKPGAGLDCCTDMAFMLGNFFLKRRNKKAAKDIILSLQACNHDLKPHIAARLLYDASRLRDNNRASFWNDLAKQLDANDTFA